MNMMDSANPTVWRSSWRMLRCVEGWPTSAILLEPRSINTREHPIEALKLSGVTSTTPIAVVTSDWHIRRAEQEFRRYFQQVYNYPAPSLQGALGLQSLIPSADSLVPNVAVKL